MTLIQKILWHNSWVSSPGLLKNAFLEHFSSLFDKDVSYIAFRIGSLTLRKLEEADVSWLERDISMEEVEYALKCSPLEKTPRSDGYNMGCMKLLQGKIKLKVLNCFNDFIRKGIFPKV